MEPVSNAEGALGALGVTLKNLVAGAIGSFVSLRFFDGLKTWERWTTFFGGWGMAAFGAGPLTHALEQKPTVEVGIALLIGLFGMALTSKILQTIKETDWIGFAKTIIKTIRGGGSNQ